LPESDTSLVKFFEKYHKFRIKFKKIKKIIIRNKGFVLIIEGLGVYGGGFYLRAHVIIDHEFMTRA